MRKLLDLIIIVFILVSSSPSEAQRKKPDPIDRKGRVTVCTGSLSMAEWSFRYNKFVAKPAGIGISIEPIAYLDSFHQCNNKKTQKFRIVDGEYALNDAGDLRVVGDICAPEPLVVFSYLRGNRPLSIEALRYISGYRHQSLLSTAPAGFYLWSDALAQEHHQLRRKVESLRLLTERQCGRVPDAMRISARTDFSPAIVLEHRLGAGKPGKYAYRELFAGALGFHTDGNPFIPDDKAEQILYEVVVGKHYEAVRKRYRYDPNRAATGLVFIALGALLMNGETAIDPLCSNEMIPRDERIALGC